MLARPLLATAPATLEEALRRAEDMREVDPETTGDTEEWRVSALRNQERRCFQCQGLGHLAAQCPERNTSRAYELQTQTTRDPGTTPLRPVKPCVFCQRTGHFPINCPRIPQCELCGRKGHAENQCEIVVLGRTESLKPAENSQGSTTEVPKCIPLPLRDQSHDASRADQQ